MSEENTPSTTQIPKNENWKTILTIVFLVVLWPIGLILTWFLAPWKRKVKIIITVALFAVLFISLMAMERIATTIDPESIIEFLERFRQAPQQ